jgi:hypothetical protein
MRKMVKSDRYQCNQGKRGIQWDRVQIEVSRKGSGPHKKIVLKMIGTMVIREKSVNECSYRRHPPAYKPVRCGI